MEYLSIYTKHLSSRLLFAFFFHAPRSPLTISQPAKHQIVLTMRCIRRMIHHQQPKQHYYNTVSLFVGRQNAESRSSSMVFFFAYHQASKDSHCHPIIRDVPLQSFRRNLGIELGLRLPTFSEGGFTAGVERPP